MASHNQVVTIRPRSLANVLSDLKEARDDVSNAHAALATLACRHGVLSDDEHDRALEAETRLDDLREEFEARFKDATGLTIADVLKAREEAVL